ncbi:MADF domain [Cinara cedri]|uniref:MADF domain n=1 Tax=Cinara cedri TaxID=506608 RepID=A0A5E4MQZ9_9HEMI|nr:MADF domain [Cinara cedri]
MKNVPCHVVEIFHTTSVDVLAVIVPGRQISRATKLVLHVPRRVSSETNERSCARRCLVDGGSKGTMASGANHIRTHILRSEMIKRVQVPLSLRPGSFCARVPKGHREEQRPENYLFVDHVYTVNGSAIDRVESKNDFGVLFSPDLSFRLHIEAPCQSFTCLWLVKSKEYLDSNKKGLAYAEMVKKYKEIDLSAGRNTVVKTMNALRTVYKKELSKN